MSRQYGRFALVLAAALALAAGCSSSETGGSTAPKSTDGCVANALKNTEGGFCLVTPPGSKALPPANSDANNRNYSFLDGNGAGVNVDVSKLDDLMTWDWTVKGYQANATNSDRSQQQQGDLPGGGKYWSYVQGGSKRTDVITHKENVLFTCNTVGAMPDGPTVDSCKSIRPL
jgi:hypothetical protein